jgi:predicted nucleic acid-binding OB-fold protein
MVSVVKCLICNQQLKYSRSDPSELIDHLRLQHRLESQRSKKSFESLEEVKKKASVDLNNSLKRNSDSLRSLIDKEVQTEINWRFFATMEDQSM